MTRNLSIVIVCFAAILAYGCSDNNAAEKKTAAPPAEPHYALATAEKTSVEQVYKLPAQLAAYQEVSIFPKVNGYVKTVSVDVGSKVTQGKLLMVLQDPELEQEALQAK